MDHLELSRARQVVFRSLKYRPRSEQEVVEKLRSKDFSDDIIRETVLYFKRIGEINDQRFALGWIRSRLNKPLGIRRIGHELKQKGVTDSIIRQALEEAGDGYLESDAVVSLARQRLRQYRALERTTAKRRLYHYLVRRGFDQHIILTCLHHVFSESS